MIYVIEIIIFILIYKIPKWVADAKYNASDNKPNIGKMLEDKYSNNLSDTQVKNNIANGKYD